MRFPVTENIIKLPGTRRFISTAAARTLLRLAKSDMNPYMRGNFVPVAAAPRRIA
jgi:hypothetical protein